MASDRIHPSYSPAAALPGSVPGPFSGAPQLAVPHPLQHRMVCETVSPRHHVPYSLEGAVPEQVLQEFQGGGGGITPCCSRAPQTAQSLEQRWRGSRAGQMRPSDKVVTLLLAQAELHSTATSPASKPQPGYCEIKICERKHKHLRENVMSEFLTSLILLLNCFKSLPCSRTLGQQ